MRSSFKTGIAFVLTIAVALSNWFMVYSFADDYTLQQNEVVVGVDENTLELIWGRKNGIYKEIYARYNCYAFAIGRGEDSEDYGTGGGFIPGCIAGIVRETENTSLSQMAAMVRADLWAMGCSNVSYSIDQIPENFSPNNPNQQLICLRLGHSIFTSEEDFHFMRYDVGTNAWYHKPGTSAILKYTGILQEDWVAEYSKGTGDEGKTGYIYTGSIAYITYDKNIIEITGGSSLEKSIEANKDILCELNITQQDTYTISMSSNNPINYELYKVDFNNAHNNMHCILSNNDINGANECSISITLDDAFGRYFLRVSFANGEDGSVHYTCNNSQSHLHSFSSLESIDNTSHKTTCSCGFFEVQTHSYPRWIYYNNFVHKKTCTCGYSITESHYVRRSDIVDGRYANCLSCLRRLDLNVDHAGIIMSNVVKVSANGSYILASGVVVLVDADVEAYLNGTLEFNEQVNVPPTSDV